MGLLRLFLRLLVRQSYARTRYEFTAPDPDPGPDGPGISTLHVTRERLVTITVTEGATLSGKCWVIDGDTIDIGGRRIRLAGIDAPELDHPYGKAARSTLIRLSKGQVIRAEFDGQASYERTMATCYLPDGRDLSAEMVKAGMAIDWPKYSGGRYRLFEVDGIRRKLWRCDARQRGRMPPLKPGQD